MTDQSLLEFNTDDGRRAGVPGGGAISTAGDVALFYQALLHDPQGSVEARPARRRDERRAQPLGRPHDRQPGQPEPGPRHQGRRRPWGAPARLRSVHLAARASATPAWAGRSPGLIRQSGLCFCHLTNGLDRNPIRQASRSFALSKRAGALRGTVAGHDRPATGCYARRCCRRCHTRRLTPVSRRKGRLSPLVFFCTWPVSELPMQTAMFQMAHDRRAGAAPGFAALAGMPALR